MNAIPFLVLSCSFIDVLNPTIENIIDKSSQIIESDYKLFRIYDEKYKILELEQVSFLGHGVKFIAYAKDSIGTLSSILIYANDEGDLLSDLAKTFGHWNSISSLEAGILSRNEVRLVSQSYGWKKETCTMLVEIYGESKPARIWITKKNIK
jgi:hypothetical protein